MMGLNQTPSSQVTQGQPSSFKRGKRNFNYKDYYVWMNEQLSTRIPSLAVALLGNPTHKRPSEWRWGKKGELVVYVAGDKIGRFSDFESGASGDALELITYKTGYRGKELSDWVKNFIGYISKASVKQNEQTWTPIIPVPEEALKDDITKGLKENFQRLRMFETGRYCYRDLEGNIFGYVVRFEKGKDKMTLPLTYCTNERGGKSWWWKGFPVPRLPYGAELLKNSNKSILIVEGEKKCEVARGIFPEMTVMTWVAGTGSIHLTDWSSLSGREIVLWPDNDEPGLRCMKKLKTILEKGGVNSIRVVSLPADTPQGWDLADELPEGWDMASLDNLIRDSI